uniref:C2H2-type domain-containing protein n=1 Tax=Steinernema glaseri TaxID=37863 RepID=A0A1I8A692_9BILA
MRPRASRRVRPTRLPRLSEAARRRPAEAPPRVLPVPPGRGSRRDAVLIKPTCNGEISVQLAMYEEGNKYRRSVRSAPGGRLNQFEGSFASVPSARLLLVRCTQVTRPTSPSCPPTWCGAPPSTTRTSTCHSSAPSSASPRSSSPSSASSSTVTAACNSAILSVSTTGDSPPSGSRPSTPGARRPRRTPTDPGAAIDLAHAPAAPYSSGAVACRRTVAVLPQGPAAGRHAALGSLAIGPSTCPPTSLCERRRRGPPPPATVGSVPCDGPHFAAGTSPIRVMVCRNGAPEPAGSSSPPSPNTALALLIASATASSNPDPSASPSSSPPPSSSSMDPTVQAIVSSLAGSAAPGDASSATSPSPNGTTNPSGSHQCSMCSKSFATSKLLQNHQHMFHTEKAFICEICGKAFRFRSNLAEHRSVHTALKPYVCKFCGKSSRLKGNLTKHILKHHKLEQNAYIGKDDIIIKKGKKSVKDPAAVDFLQKSMIVLTASGNAAAASTVSSGDTPSRETTVDEEADASRSFFMSLGLDAGSMDLSGNSPDDGSLHGGEQLLDASATDRHEATNDFDSDTSNASPSTTATVSAPNSLVGNGGETPIHLRSLRTQCAECGKHFRKEPARDPHVAHPRLSPARRLRHLLGRRPQREEFGVRRARAERRQRPRAPGAPPDQVHDRRAPLLAQHRPARAAPHGTGRSRGSAREAAGDGAQLHLHARPIANRHQHGAEPLQGRRLRPAAQHRSPPLRVLRLKHLYIVRGPRCRTPSVPL